MFSTSMKLFSTAISAYRYFSTKTTTKGRKWTPYKNKNKNKMNEPKNPNKRTRIKWTDQQSQILEAISNGKSVFITGSAGTGKTVLLQHIIKRLHKLHGRGNVFVTASTGVAACALQGQTLNSFAGTGPAYTDRQTLHDRVFSDSKAYRRWKKAGALVIDEISMVNAQFFAALKYIAEEVRGEKQENVGVINNGWGGIQLVVSGDLFQLPPIINRENLSGKEFVFEADCWNSSFDMQVELTKVFRQSEARLIKLLQNIRRGQTDPEDLQLLEKCCSETDSNSSPVVQLYPRNEDVNKVNLKKMEELEGYMYVYRALDCGDDDASKRQLKQGITADELILKEGARVMLTKNLNTWRKLVNGATGTVMQFCGPYGVDVSDICKDKVLPLVKFDSGLEMIIHPQTWVVMEGDKIVAKRKQMPLILAWALSIHKCQGMTLDSLHTDLSKAFGFGMVYVALSRVRSLDGLHLSGFEPSKIRAHPKVIQFYQDKQGEDDGVNKDKSSSSNDAIHVSSKTISKEMNKNLNCKPNSSLISWYNRVTRRALG